MGYAVKLKTTENIGKEKVEVEAQENGVNNGGVVQQGQPNKGYDGDVKGGGYITATGKTQLFQSHDELESLELNTLVANGSPRGVYYVERSMEAGRKTRGVGPVEEMSVTNKGEQWHGPIENLSFSIGHGILLSVKPKKSARRVHVGSGKKCKNGVSKILGEERKNDGGLEPGMDDSGKRLKVIDVVDKEDALLTVAEVGIDQPREGQ